MKMKTLLGITLLALMAFRSGDTTTGDAKKYLVNTVYCGYISASCNGVLSVEIGFYGSGPYLIALYDNGVAIPVQVRSISTVPGSSNVFALDIIYNCNGSQVNYVGNAYCMVC